MCCFFIPLAEASVLTAANSLLKKTGKGKSLVSHFDSLSKLLYGGSLLLALEHIWHEEIIFAPPFITAMKTPEDLQTMLDELSTTGVGMALVTTVAYIGFACLEKYLKKNTADTTATAGQN